MNTNVIISAVVVALEPGEEPEASPTEEDKPDNSRYFYI
jgi:hypothetical protein